MIRHSFDSSTIQKRLSCEKRKFIKLTKVIIENTKLSKPINTEYETLVLFFQILSLTM